jgi:L-iditol 2-dehydrogenase
MRALVKCRSGPGNVALQDVPEPLCTPGRVKIRVHFSGICGTDLHVYHDRFRNYPPVILGHEFSGVVEEVGAGVSRVQAGDRVTVLPASAVVCGKCVYCRQGYVMFCPERRGMGHGVDGSFAKYAMVREEQVYRVPASVSLEEAAVCEPFACAVQAIGELAPVSAGDTVLVSGPGPIGLCCALMLVASKCKVIVAGACGDENRLALARSIGAAVALDATRDDLAAVIALETNGRGVDIAVEASGSADSIRACLHAVRPLGCYVQIGIAGTDVTVPFDLTLFKQLRLFGSVGYSLSSWERLLRILDQRQIDLKPLISHTLPLSRWREAFDLCEQKKGVKVLLYYDE